MAVAIKVGAIIHLRNTAPDSGYLDSYGFVAAKAEFWNVAGTERIFVSTYKDADRGGGTTSWQILSAEGKQNGEPLRIGDRIHLRNMYADAGYLDCCGWVEDLMPFNTETYRGKVRCAVFTAGAANRDNGTGIWIIQAANKSPGDALFEGDSITLVNGYPENKQLVDTAHAETGALVAYGAVAQNAAFRDFQNRQLLVFTSTNPDITLAHGSWTMSLSMAYSQADALYGLFDFFRPELLKGRSHAMENVSSMTGLVLLDVLHSISGKDIGESQQSQPSSSASSTQPDEQQGSTPALLDTLLKAGSTIDAPNVIDYDFQVKQLWNLFVLSKTLNSYDQTSLQGLMQQVLTTSIQEQSLPALDLIRSCFQHIATDHEIIQQASMQRRWNKTDGKYHQSSQALELLIMDKLALKALLPFQHVLPTGARQPAVITYFSNTTHIHRLPYTDQCILLGVSYDRISPNDLRSNPKTLTEKNFASFELMAIPHEIGHYIYQHGIDKGKTFRQIGEQFKNKAYYSWCEELFADLYGCMIAGPLSVFSMQSFLTSGKKKSAWHDDDEHPTPIIRPFILSEMLHILSTLDSRYDFAGITHELDLSWTETLRKWGYERVDAGTARPARLYVPDDTSTQLERVINVKRVIESVRELIETYARRLLQTLPATQADAGNPATHQSASLSIPWRSNLAQGNTTTERYAHEMALLTGATTARDILTLAILEEPKTPESTSTDQAANAEERLQDILDVWGDKGPHGWGGH